VAYSKIITVFSSQEIYFGGVMVSSNKNIASIFLSIQLIFRARNFSSTSANCERYHHHLPYPSRSYRGSLIDC
jgi:hypothetical protein